MRAYDGRVDSVHADLREPLPISQPVDAIFSTATFHWITDHHRLFRNLASVTAPDGMFCAQWGGAGNIKRVTDVLDARGVEWHDDKYFATVDGTVAALTAAGWTVDDCWLEPAPTPFTDDAAPDQWLRTVILGSLLNRCSPSEGDEIVRAVVRAIPDHVLDYVRINALARRIST